MKRWPAQHYMFVPREGGPFRGLNGHELEKLEFETNEQLQQAQRAYPIRYESDIPPLFKCLMNNYYDLPTPTVHFAFVDIEVDYKSNIGFAGPSNPYAPINAVTIYSSWTKGYVTYVVPPKGWKGSVADIEAKFDELVKDGSLHSHQRTRFVICRHEIELLQHLVQDIQEADIVSGWNSEFFDLPYIIERLKLMLPKMVAKLSFAGARAPRERMVERFGSQEKVYTLYGRTHLDYLDLFKKFTFEGRESFALGNILQEEVGLSKLHYEGTLEQLYNNDFPTFCCYNFRDVSGMVDLDEKFKFIQLVNQMAHENTCLFENILGTVRYVETGIANRAIRVHGLRVPDKRVMTDGEKVEGAIVLNPRIGMHPWVGSVDITSLYPSVIRSLNISPEKFIGQFLRGEEDWRGIMEGDELEHVLKDDEGETFVSTGAEWRDILRENKWAISAYGTVFDEGSGQGLVADTLTFWFAERKRLQAEKKKWAKEVKRLEAEIKERGVDDQLRAELQHAEQQEAHYDLLQLTKKIQLNSTYGALLNAAFRFGRKEMGASVTACGRAITTHMMETISSLLEPNNRQKLVKTTEVDPKDGSVAHIYTIGGDVVIYGDTDSCYFKTHATNKDEAVLVADETAKLTNESFPDFMRRAFFCQPTYDELIKAGREVVAERGLFQAKKKYVLKVVDLEGFAVDKLKSQGSEIKKSDTPKAIQEFLKSLMKKILSGAEYPEIEEFVNSQRKQAVGKDADLFSLGVAKQANNLDGLYAEWQRTEKVNKGKVRLPGHIRAAVNYNEAVQRHEQGPKLLKSGDKVRIFYLKPNADGFKSIAFPGDADSFPAWFGDNYQVDRALTEQKMFDNKLDGIFSAIGWELPTPQNTLLNKIFTF